MHQITAAAFLDALSGAVIEKVDTDNHDVFIHLTDGRVVLVSAYAGNIILAQLSIRQATLQ